MIIEEINEREDLQLLNVDREALDFIANCLSTKERSTLKGIFGNRECRTLGAISFFVKFDSSGADFEEIYAFSGNIPNLNRSLYPIRVQSQKPEQKVITSTDYAFYGVKY